MNYFRDTSRGLYDTNFDFLNDSKALFPSKEVRERNSVYRFCRKLNNGSYASNKRLIAMIDGISSEIDYKTLSINYFKLLTNKMADVVFNNDFSIRTGDIERDKKVLKLVDDTCWIDGIRKAFKKSTIYGTSFIKTYKGGVSAFDPLNAFVIVDEHNKSKIKGYVLYEYIYTNEGGVKTLSHVRFEIHFCGSIFEIVKRYSGSIHYGTVGHSVDFNYNGRLIKASGMWYQTGIDDCELVKMLSINTESDSVYGASLYDDIKDVVFAVEQRLSSEYHSLNNLQNPFLVIGASAIQTDQKTGERSVKLIDNKILVQREGDGVVPSFVSPEYKLDASEAFIETARDLVYELSELSKCYMTGEFSGSLSTESIDSLMKSAIDKANRLLTEVYYSIRDSLYALCRLNDIEITKADINITFNLGRTDDQTKIMDICQKAIDSKLLSRASLREKYFGYNKEQSIEEDRLIQSESRPDLEHYSDIIKNLNNDLDFEQKDESSE